MVQVTFIAGDGIGPSICHAAREIIDATGVSIEWIEAVAGDAAHKSTGSPLPKETFAKLRQTGVGLKAPCATPVGAGFRSVNVALCQEFDLYANVRLAKALPGVQCLFPDLDLVVIRENTEGLYSSMEHWVGAGRQAAMGIGINTRGAIERIFRFAFDYAIANGRRKVTVVHRADVLKILSGLILEVAREMSADYPGVEFEDRIVDNVALQLVLDPQQFDVIVTTNLVGDILSDLTAGLIGGLSVAPGANYGDDAALFEAVHGTASDIAGRDLANPTSMILAGSMMLRHLGCDEEADLIANSLNDVLLEGTRVTRDLNDRGVGTKEMAAAIIERIESARRDKRG